MPTAFDINELRCVDMTISQKLVVETESGPVEWRRLNRANLAWAEKRLLAAIGERSSDWTESRERASVCFLWHLASVLDGQQVGDRFRAFAMPDGDNVEAFWSEWKDRKSGADEDVAF